MAETANIARIAEQVSRDLFEVFNWNRIKITNCNWKCIDPVRHSTGSGTHPTDVVWHYEEPYETKRTYIQADLKSYACKSISRAAIQASLRNLAMAVECAPDSPEWRNYFWMEESCPSQVVGLLFIYNHDGDFDSDFSFLMQEPIDGPSFKMKAGTRIMVMGPRMIWELCSIALDIKQFPAEYGLGLQWVPFYPEGRLRQFRRFTEISCIPMTVDALFSNVISFKVKPFDYQGDYQDLHVYYRGPGETKEEFLNLVDSFFRDQTIETAGKIVIHHVSSKSPNDAAVLNFERACNEIASLYNVGNKKLESLEFETLSLTKPGFTATEIGMRL